MFNKRRGVRWRGTWVQVCNFMKTLYSEAEQSFIYQKVLTHFSEIIHEKSQVSLRNIFELS